MNSNWFLIDYTWKKIFRVTLGLSLLLIQIPSCLNKKKKNPKQRQFQELKVTDSF